MRKATLLLASGVVFTTLAFAENWSGSLLDASCYDAQKNASACAASSKTTSFALDVSGKIYKLDANGNSKAATALKSRADRSADPSKTPAAAVMATIAGSEKSGTITVESLDIN